MSEIKRVNLTTVEASQKDKKVDTKKRTYRFELSLGESNAKICPEYSFAELAKNLRHSNGGDLFDESDDVNVAAIAQKFEAKYGPKAMQSGKKHRTQEMDDFYDLGDGYNEDDSFIDNTEFYDEVVPYSLTTKHGGFYINQGKLDFKSLNDDSIDEFSSPKPMKKKKKRVLDSDSGGEDAVEETGEALSKKFKAMKRKKLLESKEGEKKKKKLLAGPDGEIVIKKKKKKNLEKLKLKKVSGSSSPQKVDECQTPVPATPAVPVVATPMTPVLNTPATNGSAEVINLDNDPQLKDFKHSLEETFNAILQGVKEDSSSKSGGEEVKGDQQSTDKNTQLPSQLPPDLAEAIENIKKAARESKEGKSKFFSTYVNKLLLDIELGSKNLQWGSRTSIYNHLGEHLPCGKHALLRRAKKLRESQQEVPLKIPLQRLREAIMREMPGLVEQHEQDVAKAKLEAELKDENPETVKEEGSTESDEEEKSDNKKKPRGPRRKFQWTEEIRDLLLDIVATKMKSYNLCKSRNQTAEDFIRAYLDTDIKPIWPQGWMQTRMLFKESRAAHEDMTKVLNKEPKQKKNVSLVKASSPTPEQSNQDTVRAHVSKTEDVIEITDEKTDTVVVNLPNVDVKPLSTVSTYNSSPKISQSSNADTSAGSRINKQANTPWTVLATPTSTPMSQKPSDNLNNSSSKWSQKAESAVPSVTPTSPSVQKIPVISRSSHQGLSPPVSSSTPGGADNSPTSANSTRTFMTAFESFAGAYSRSDTTASISSPQTPKQSILGQQQALTFEQQQLASPQQKSSQEQKVVNAQQQKAAARSSSSVVVNKDIPNASWSNVNSVVPQGKTSSPAGLIGRVPVISPSTVGGSSDKSRQLLVHQEKQTKFINTVCAKLDQSTSSNKKRAQVSNMGSSYQTSPQQKQSSMSYPYPMSSKQDMQQRNTVPSSNGPSPAHKWSGSTSQQIQSCTVIGTSSSIHGPNMPFMRALGPGTPNVQPNAKSKQTYGTIRQPSPPQKAQSTLPRPSAHNETGLLNSPMVSVSRGSTPSPQRSPISPEQPSLSLYEQIQSQIRNQEAMEGQALKNLAMALSYTNSSNPGFQGVKPAQIRGMHSEVSDSQSTSAVVTSKSIIPSPIQALPVQSCEKLDRPVQPKQHSVILGRDCDSFGVQYSAREWGGKSPGDKSLSKKEFEVTETAGVYTETTAADSKHVTGGNEFSTYMIQSKKMEPQQRSDVTAEYYRESLIFKKPFQTFKSPGSYAPQTRATAPIKINCVDKPSGKAIYKQNVSQGQPVHRSAANMVLDSKCNDIMAKFTADPKVTNATRDHQHIASPAGDCLFPADQMLNHSLPQYPYSLKYAEHSTDKSLETQTFPGQVSVQNMLNSAPPSVSLGEIKLLMM